MQTFGKFTLGMPGMELETGNIQCGNVSFQFPSMAQHRPHPVHKHEGVVTTCTGPEHMYSANLFQGTKH